MAALDMLGFEWNCVEADTWIFIEALQVYARDHDESCDVPLDHVTKSGVKLGKWVKKARRHRPKTLTVDQVEALGKLGFELAPHADFMDDS
jgi:hypothetical protein